ncbi:MAG: efflux RND transporter permease subunit, partial [Candidatus Latescibacteria bacterium]|nr:efflux RND transporter permease subunit [Candidatus Latescibacterota bacterium]
QSTFINQSVNAVLSTAVVGGILAILVLYLFLNNLKSTIIIGLAIPISVVSTFFWMYLFGVSLNIMSLGGLALGIGMLVDSAIVVLEAIDRRRKEGLGQAEAAYEGASEVGQAVIASTMTTVCVFAPIIFVEGIAGQLFADLALTVTFSLLVALAVAVTLIPMLASLTLDEGDPETNRAVIVTASTIRRASWAVLAIGFFGRTAITPIRWVFDRWFGWVQRIYPNLLNTAIERRVVMSLGAVGVFGVSLLATRGLGVELIPELSQGELLVSVELAAGASLSRTDRTLRDMTDRISDMPQIAQIYSVAGAQGQSSGAATDEQEHVGQISMRLTDEATREIEDALIDTLGQKFRDVPGMTYRFSRPTLFSFRTPIEVEVYGEDLSLLASISDMLSAKMKDIPGLFDVASTQASGTPELQVTFNRDRLAAANSSVSAVAGVIRAEVEGEIATEFVEGDRNIDIRVRAAADSRTGVQTLSQIIINPTKDIPIPLSAVAYIHESIGPTEIRRIDQQRVALVTSNVRGRDLGAVAEDIQLAIEESNLPLGVGAVVAGQRAEMETSFDSMRFAGALAVFLVYLVMASQFESLVHPFVVMFTMPFGAIGVIAALLLTGTTVNVIALIGAIMLAGIVVNNAIVLIDAINQGRASGLSVDDAVRRGGAIRLRPILMTTA